MWFNQPVCNLWNDQSGLCIRLLMIDFWGGLHISQFDKKIMNDKNGQGHNGMKSFLEKGLFFNFDINFQI